MIEEDRSDIEGVLKDNIFIRRRSKELFGAVRWLAISLLNVDVRREAGAGWTRHHER